MIPELHTRLDDLDHVQRDVIALFGIYEITDPVYGWYGIFARTGADFYDEFAVSKTIRVPVPSEKIDQLLDRYHGS